MKTKILLLLPALLLAVAANSQSQPKDPRNYVDGDDSKGGSSGGTTSPTSDYDFLAGKYNVSLSAGSEKRFGSVGIGLNFQTNLSVRLGAKLNTRSSTSARWYFDYLTVKVRTPFSLLPQSSIGPTGIGFLTNAKLDLVTGFQAFKLPSLSKLLSFSVFQGYAGVNILRSPASKADRPYKPVVSLDYGVVGSYTPLNLEPALGIVNDKIQDVNEYINELTKKEGSLLTNPLGSLLNKDSLKRQIYRLTRLVTSLSKLPSVKSLEEISNQTISKFLFYHGPTLNFSVNVANIPNLSMQAYAQFLWPLNKPTSTAQLLDVNLLSILDTVAVIVPLLDTLLIGHATEEAGLKKETYSSRLFVAGAQLNYKLKLVNFSLSAQYTDQVDKAKPQNKALDFITKLIDEDKKQVWTYMIGMTVDIGQMLRKQQ